MKINPSQIARAMEIYRAQKPMANRAEDKGEHKQDEVILSDKAKAFQVALKAVSQNDGVDHAKVERLKREIETGEYEVDSQRIANKIVDDILSRKRV